MYGYKQLQCFLSIVEEGGFTLAADKLYMTQPAISWQIKALEEELGLQLIDRGERKLVLTEAGRIFYRHARTIHNQYVALQDEMQQFKNKASGKLCLGASTLPGEFFMPEELAKFSLSYPKAEVELVIAPSQKIISLLGEERIHLGVVGFKPDDDHLWSVAYREDDIVCIAPKEHKLCKQKGLSLSDLGQEKILLRRQGSGTRIKLEEALREKKVSLQGPKTILGSTRAIVEAVKAGMGISWVSKRAMLEAPVCVLDIQDFHLERVFYIVGRKKRTLSPLASSFCAQLEEK